MVSYSGPSPSPVTNTTVQTFVTVTAPPPGIMVQLTTPGAGYYKVDWRVSLSGTITAAELNNVIVRIVNGATLVRAVTNASGHDVDGTLYVALTASQSLAMSALVQGGVAAVYSMSLIATNLGPVYS